MHKKMSVLLLIFALGMMPAAASADGPGCPKCQECLQSAKKGLKDKLFKLIHAVYDHQEELGVSDEQLQQVKAVKIPLKKDLIRLDADVEIVAVDIKAMLGEDEINVDAVNALVDRKYEAKKEKTKKIIAAFARVKEILTDEQCDQLKKMMCSEKGKFCPMMHKKMMGKMDSSGM